MRKRIGMSVLAFSAALAVAPAGAIDLNLGGDGPLVDLSTSASEPTVDVNLNNDSGVTVDLNSDSGPAVTIDTNTDSSSGATDLLDLGGGTPDATIDLNGGGDPNDVVVDLGNDNGNDVVVDLFGNGAVDGDVLNLDEGGLVDIGEGGLIDLGGADDEIEVNLGGADDSVLVDLFGDGEDAVVDLDALGDDELVVDILDQQAPIPATRIRLPDTDGLELGDGDDLLDLGDVDVGNLPAIDLGDGDGLLDLDGVVGGDVIPGLFGAGGSVLELGDFDLGNLPNIDIGDLGIGDLGIGDVAGNLPDINVGDAGGNLPDVTLPDIDLGNLPDINIGDLGGLPDIDIGDTIGDTAGLPDLGGNGVNGVDGADGDDGDDGDTTVVVINQPPGGGEDPALPDPGLIPDGPGITPGSPGGNTTTVINSTNRATTRRVAQQDAKCFAPNDQQIANLVSRKSYTANGMANWRAAKNVTIVPVRLCPESRVRVSQVTYANANMAALRNGIAQSPAIQAKLNGTGRDAGDVLAVDTKDGQLVVYIY